MADRPRSLSKERVFVKRVDAEGTTFLEREPMLEKATLKGLG